MRVATTHYLLFYLFHFIIIIFFSFVEYLRSKAKTSIFYFLHTYYLQF